MVANSTGIVNSPGAYGMYPHDAELELIMRALVRSGVDRQDICMMLSPSHPIATIVREANVLSDGRNESGVAAKLMGWLLEFGAVMIPTVGFFIRSQAFLQALVADRDCPTSNVRGNSRALVGLGFPEGDAERFASQLRDVGVLVYVACPEKSDAVCAVEVLRQTGAHEPALLGKPAAMAPAV